MPVRIRVFITSSRFSHCTGQGKAVESGEDGSGEGRVHLRRREHHGRGRALHPPCQSTHPAGLASRGATSSLSSTSLPRSEEHTSELQSRENLVCRLLLEKKNDHRL